MAAIPILPGLSLREDEVVFSASRSGGPGGQNVNKVNSRVTLRFDVAGSGSLSPEQKRRILARLSTRVSGEGVLRVVAQRSRSQAANREAALERLAELLRQALATARARRKWEVSAAARRRRVEEKRHHAEIKRERSRRRSWED